MAIEHEVFYSDNVIVSHLPAVEHLHRKSPVLSNHFQIEGCKFKKLNPENMCIVSLYKVD